jgi:glycosyltransferase involved in cell wall biosynthesis
MNVTFVIPYFYPALQYGGQPKSAYELARALVSRGHTVRVLTTDSAGESRLPSGRRQVDGIDVVYYRNLSNSLAFRQRIFWAPALFREMKEQLKSADVLHIHELRATSTVSAYRAAKALGKPFVISTHGGLRHLGRKGLKVIFDRLWGRRLLEDAAAVIAISPVEEGEARTMGVQASRIHELPNMIAPEEYGPLPPKGLFRSRLKLGGKRVILFLGRLHWIKGADILLDAFRRLGDDKAHLVIAGPDDGQESELRRNAGPGVTFAGYLDHKAKLEAFVDADILVVPSRSEVFAITAVEALACGCPVILSDVCGLHPMPSRSEGVIAFRSEDAADLASKLSAALNDPELRASAKAGTGFVQANFAKETIGERAEHIYRKVIR